MRNKKTGAETPEYRYPMPPTRPLRDLDELSRESDSVPIYRKAMAGVSTRKRLIDADGCGRFVAGRIGAHFTNVVQVVEAMAEYTEGNTVDAVEVVHGRWIDGKCSNCNAVFTVEVDGEVLELREIHSCYCPDCGAKMDGGGNG